MDASRESVLNRIVIERDGGVAAAGRRYTLPYFQVVRAKMILWSPRGSRTGPSRNACTPAARW